MLRISLLLLCLNFILPAAWPQVVPPAEMKDPDLRGLQERNMDALKQFGADILALPTDYPFYLSRKLDLDEAKQKWADQRSIQFDRYKGKVVLEITGNYFAAYSAEKMSPDQRARATFVQIIEPILKSAVARFQNNAEVQAYAFEISHHVLGKVNGVSVERPENVVVVLPQLAATSFVKAADDSARQSALLQAEVFLNAKPLTLWLNGEGPQLAQQLPEEPSKSAQDPQRANAEIVNGPENHTAENIDKLPSPVHVPILKPVQPAEPPKPPRDLSPAGLASLQVAQKPLLDTVVKELDPQAHFVSYAPPSFIAFRQGIYLEFSINTSLTESPSASRYRLAALAFDDHIARLIRPVLGYFKNDPQFDGISFSANLHPSGNAKSNPSSQAVEFLFPFSALRCYERYDCTGQQLIDAGAVLINGERVSLDLQIAEGGGNR